MRDEPIGPTSDRVAKQRKRRRPCRLMFMHCRGGSQHSRLGAVDVSDGDVEVELPWVGATGPGRGDVVVDALKGERSATVGSLGADATAGRTSCSAFNGLLVNATVSSRTCGSLILWMRTPRSTGSRWLVIGPCRRDRRPQSDVVVPTKRLRSGPEVARRRAADDRQNAWVRPSKRSRRRRAQIGTTRTDGRAVVKPVLSRPSRSGRSDRS